jgi:hypothetical protein
MLYHVTVTGMRFWTYEVAADTPEKASEMAKKLFSNDFGSGFDDIESSAEECEPFTETGDLDDE